MIEEFLISILVSVVFSLSLCIILVSIFSREWLLNYRKQQMEENEKLGKLGLTTREYYSIVGSFLLVLEGSFFLSDASPPVNSVDWIFIAVGSLMIIAGGLLQVKSYGKIKLNMFNLEQRIKNLEDKLKNK